MSQITRKAMETSGTAKHNFKEWGHLLVIIYTTSWCYNFVWSNIQIKQPPCYNYIELRTTKWFDYTMFLHVIQKAIFCRSFKYHSYKTSLNILRWFRIKDVYTVHWCLHQSNITRFLSISSKWKIPLSEFAHYYVIFRAVENFLKMFLN